MDAADQRRSEKLLAALLFEMEPSTIEKECVHYEFSDEKDWNNWTRVTALQHGGRRIEQLSWSSTAEHFTWLFKRLNTRDIGGRAPEELDEIYQRWEHAKLALY